MKHIREGKTKSVYQKEDGNIVLVFKDNVTTGSDGSFDPGANTSSGTIEGAGSAALAMSTYFFELLDNGAISTHFIGSDLDKKQMTVKAATPFGEGVEVICRLKAVGSFYRRYALYVQEGQPLDYLVEVTLKDDARQDPLINVEALCQLNIMTEQEHAILTTMTKDITAFVADVLEQKGLELYDIKLEFGKDIDGNIMLIDEISGGNMRVFQDGKPVDPIRLSMLITQP